MKTLCFLLFLAFIPLISPAQNPYEQTDSLERAKLHAAIRKSYPGKFKLGFIYKYRQKKVLEKINHFLLDSSPDILILYRRGDIYLESNQIELAVQDYMQMLEVCEPEQRGSWAQNNSYILLELVAKGYTAYKDECCYLNKIRIEAGLWVQSCMDSYSFVGVCGCESNN